MLMDFLFFVRQHWAVNRLWGLKSHMYLWFSLDRGVECDCAEAGLGTKGHCPCVACRL